MATGTRTTTRVLPTKSRVSPKKASDSMVPPSSPLACRWRRRLARAISTIAPAAGEPATRGTHATWGWGGTSQTRGRTRTTADDARRDAALACVGMTLPPRRRSRGRAREEWACRSRSARECGGALGDRAEQHIEVEGLGHERDVEPAHELAVALSQQGGS